MAKVRPQSRRKIDKPKPLTPEQIERRKRWTRRLVHACGVVAVVGAFAIGYRALGEHVRQEYAVVEQPPALVLVNRPIWMNDRLAAEVAGRLARALPARGSTLDRGLLVKLHDILAADAWIERVNGIRRSSIDGRDSILIDCAYRTPLAIARWNNGRETVYQLVAANAVLLPIRYEPAEVQAILDGADRSTNLRVITGLVRPPPGNAGARWDSPQLRAGLDVAALLHDQPAARDISLIDVSNVGSSDAAQVILWTTSKTEIRWGQPPAATDFLVEASPQTKLAHLRTVYETFRGEYPRWVDLRFDAVKYLKQEPPAAEE